MSEDDTDPTPPDELPDGTLGGYIRSHARPPGFEGRDGYPYTVAIEVEKTPELRAPYVTYLVFPRWARTGLGLIGHLQSRVLARSKSEGAARRAAESLTLHEVKDILDEAIVRAEEEGAEAWKKEGA